MGLFWVVGWWVGLGLWVLGWVGMCLGFGGFGVVVVLVWVGLGGFCFAWFLWVGLWDLRELRVGWVLGLGVVGGFEVWWSGFVVGGVCLRFWVCFVLG